MPRNGSGVMQIPNTLVTQTTVEVGPHNANYADIAAELSNSLVLDGQSQLSGPLKAASGTVGSPGHHVRFGYRLRSDRRRQHRVLDRRHRAAGYGVRDVRCHGNAGGLRGDHRERCGRLIRQAAPTLRLPTAARAPVGQRLASLALTTTRGDIITRDVSNNPTLCSSRTGRICPMGRSRRPTSRTACLPK